MNAGVSPKRLGEITERYGRLRVAVVGDLCLDRYFDIDPARQEISIETNLPVHNIVRTRCQPGGAGTIINNLSALGVGTIYPVAIIGEDGEGYELRRSLNLRHSVRPQYLVETPLRATFSYTKPLVHRPGQPPEELSRLDIKNWSETPRALEDQVVDAVRKVANEVDVMVILDQVDVADTGVVTRRVQEAIGQVAREHPKLLILADSRRGLREFPSVGFKMNAAELAVFTGQAASSDLGEIRQIAARVARETGQPVFVTLSERGIIGAWRDEVEHVPALPVRGPIDIVGAGDSVTANLASALAAGATLREAVELACLASSFVIHQLGTTGTASPTQLAELLPSAKFASC